MSVAPELRAVWDVLRKEYQAVLGGMIQPGEAAKHAQENVILQISRMNERLEPDGSHGVFSDQKGKRSFSCL